MEVTMTEPTAEIATPQFYNIHVFSTDHNKTFSFEIVDGFVKTDYEELFHILSWISPYHHNFLYTHRVFKWFVLVRHREEIKEEFALPLTPFQLSRIVDIYAYRNMALTRNNASVIRFLHDNSETRLSDISKLEITQ